MPEEGKVIPVKVALRCRPLVPKEVDEGCQTCLSFVPGEPQLILGASKSFTYDFVFTPDTPQEEVYKESVSSLITGIFKGYNATVLAYGQTGSGKTFSMGGGYGVSMDTDDSIVGIIPRAIRDLFSGIEERNDFAFTVKVSYLEIYKEDLNDLLLPAEKRDKDTVTIREDTVGIKLVGLTECTVASVEETMGCLENGSHSRTVGATAMNNSSSRSHAIFTITVERISKADSSDYCKCKLHLVDLAGSERQKKTRAEGERLKEGININKGLLALGNVISALGDEAQRAKHVPYRDSKLTRLLQDSLGGNSHTVMIACVSPADSNMEETLSTLRYADRARKIKNKPIVNRDPQVAEILRLRQLVQDLQSSLVASGKPVLKSTNSSSNTSLTESQDVKCLVNKNKELLDKNHNLEKELELAWEQNELHCTKIIVLEARKEALQERLERLKESLTQMDSSDKENADVKKLVQGIIGDVMDQIDDIERTQNENFEDYLQSINNSHDGSLSEEDPTTTATTATAATNTSTQGKRDSGENKNDYDKLSEEMNQKFQERRAQMSRDLGELNKKLEMKQSRANDMKLTSDMYDKMKEEYEESIKNLTDQVGSLQSEKEGLETQLQKNRASSNANKVNETRRKRIQELETELSRKRKEITEANKMVKMKEQTVRDAEKLQREIQAMKVQRVQLMKQMKADGDAFRKFKQQKDKEVLQLKAKDRKRQVMMTKLERQFSVQQGVLKRKNEESVALTKRLNQALLKQKKVLEERVKKDETQGLSNKGANVKKHMSHELEMMVDLQEAKDHKEELVRDRAELSKEIKRLKDHLDNGPSSKRKMLNDSTGKDTDAEKEKLRERLHEMENHLALKNSNINDISSKIMELEGDANEKLKRSRFQDIKTLVDARIGLNYLLQLASLAQVKCRKQVADASNKDETVAELERQLQTLDGEMVRLKKEHEDEVEVLQREHENKILFMLKQMQSKHPPASTVTSSSTENSSKEVQSRLKFQEEQINSLSHIKDTVEERNNEIDKLKKELTRLTYNSRCLSTSLMPEFQDTNKGGRFITPSVPVNENASFFSPVVLKTPVIPKKEPVRRPVCEEVDEESEEDLDTMYLEEESFESSDQDKDQEWHAGYTPGYGTIRTNQHFGQNRREKKRTQSTRNKDSVSSFEETSQSSATSSSMVGVSCSCITTCSTKKCSCRKGDSECDDSCKCRVDKCSNRGESVLNGTFVKEPAVKDASSLESSLEFPLLKDTSNKRSLDLEDTASDSEPRKMRRTGENLMPEADTERRGSSNSSTMNITATKQKKRKLGTKKSAFFGPV